MTSNTITIIACGVAVGCEYAVRTGFLPWFFGVLLVMAAFYVAARYWKIRGRKNEE